MSLENTVQNDSAQLIKIAQANGISLTQAHIQLAAEKSQLVRVYLKNGIGLTSPVIANDSEFLLLQDKKGGLNLVNTEAVATVQTLSATDSMQVEIDNTLSVVDAALKALRTAPVHVFLINGVRLDGLIAHSDSEDLALMPMHDGHGSTQIIRWNSIASIQGYNEDITRRKQRY